MAPALSIGDLADATGLAPATLRAWERRHRFPVAERLPSGHRRYGPSQVEEVLEVLRQQRAGVRLDVAIAAARARGEDTRERGPGELSIYGALRRHHPDLAPHRLGQRTLMALSWAIEDEFCSRALGAHLFASFQQDSYFRGAEARWTDLALGAASCTVFADLSAAAAATRPGPGGPREVDLPGDAALRREWAVVCESDDLPAVLTAWELPGQHDLPSSRRLFEVVWTVDRGATRRAARVCAEVARTSGAPWAPMLVDELAPEPPVVATDAAALVSMFNRVVAYVDRQHHR